MSLVAEVRARLAAAYEITPDGRVFSIATNWRGHGRREMVQAPNCDGYPSVRLTINGRRVHIATHCLVAMQYLPPRPSPKHEIRHLDGNKNNPHFGNLCWGLPKDNADDRAKHGRTARGERNGWSKLSKNDVTEIRRMHPRHSQRKLAEMFNINRRTVQLILAREAWRHV